MNSNQFGTKMLSGHVSNLCMPHQQFDSVSVSLFLCLSVSFFRLSFRIYVDSARTAKEAVSVNVKNDVSKPFRFVLDFVQFCDQPSKYLCVKEGWFIKTPSPL